MLDDHKKLTVILLLWQVVLADDLVGCRFGEPHSTPGLVRTIHRFFALNRNEPFFKRSDLRPDDHAALAIMTTWSDDEEMPRSQVGHNVEALEASLPRLERAADALERARRVHVPIAAAA